MAEHDDELGAERFDRVFETLNAQFVVGIARRADDEQRADALVENDLGRYARIRA